MHVRKNASWPWVTSPGPPCRANLAPFWLLLNPKTKPILQKKCTKNVSIVDDFVKTSFGATCGSKTDPQNPPKNWTRIGPKKGLLRGKPPRWTKVRGYAAISSLWHTVMIIRTHQAFTTFINDLRFGQHGPKSGVMQQSPLSGTLFESFRPAKPSLCS